MPGSGGIGGGGSCWINFVVSDKEGTKRLHAFDLDCKEGKGKIRIKFNAPHTYSASRGAVSVDLQSGSCVEISW